MDTDSQAGLWGGLLPVVHRQERPGSSGLCSPAWAWARGFAVRGAGGTPVPLAVPSPGLWKLLWESTALGHGVRTTGGPRAGLGRRATLLDTSGPKAWDPRPGFPCPRAVHTA